MKARSRDLLRLIRSSDEEMQRYAAALLVAHIVDCHYFIQRRWTVPVKRTLTDLATWVPPVADLVNRCLTGRVEELFSAASALYDAVFENELTADSAMAGDRIPYRLS